MHTEATIKATTVWYMEDGNVGGGLDLYWVRGAHVVICQSWTYHASGSVYDMVYPDPMSGDNLVDYYNSAIKGRQEEGRELVLINAEIFN